MVTPDEPGNVAMDSESLTYRELAARLGVKPESARKTAQRKNWHRTTGNDGLARVIVPVEALERPEEARRDNRGDGHAEAVRELETRIELLKEVAAAERRRADAAELDRDAWRAHAQRSLMRRLFG